MALFLAAVGVAVTAASGWPLASYSYRTLFPQNPFGAFKDARLDDPYSVITPQISTFIEDTMALENLAGLSVVVVVPRHGVPEFHTWGDSTEDGDKVTPDTLFYMGSASKSFCSTALGLLIDDFATGNNVTALPSDLTELTWHTRMSDLLPDWQLMDEWASERANLRDVLSLVSGIPNHAFSFGPSDTLQEIITRLKYLRPAFELRERWSYSNIMYMVAAHVIETYSGQSYMSFVEERIFTPLGMTSSTFSSTKAKASGNLTHGWSKKGRRVPEIFTRDAYSLMAGPAGVISNAVDMAKWISMWVNKGVHQDQAVVPLSLYRNTSYSYCICTSYPSHSEQSIVGYGMGWYRSSHSGHDFVFNSGETSWVTTLVSFLPADGIGIALFVNGGHQYKALKLIQNHIFDSVLHLNGSPSPINTPSPGVTTQFRTQNLTLSLGTFSGIYTNPGYGPVTLCSPSSASSYCAGVQSDFSVVDATRGDLDSEDLLADWPRVASSHLRLRHQQGLVFDVYFTSLYPNGYGRDTTPFETAEIGVPRGLAEFVVEDGEVVGFGLSGLVGEPTERARTYKTVRDRAEVWFDKV